MEEVEALTPVDLLRRAGIQVETVSIMETKTILGSHKIPVIADALFDETSFQDADALILPGGLKGTELLDAHEGLHQVLREQAKKGKIVSANCAAPSVLAHLGLLKGKKATCFPTFREELAACGALVCEEKAVRDGCFITGRGMGASMEFSLLLIEALLGKDAADAQAAKTQFVI